MLTVYHVGVRHLPVHLELAARGERSGLDALLDALLELLDFLQFGMPDADYGVCEGQALVRCPAASACQTERLLTFEPRMRRDDIADLRCN